MRIKNWAIFSFIAGYHLLLAALLPFFIGEFTTLTWVIYFVTFILSGLSITAGYHRLFAHRSYSGHPIWEWICLACSSLAVQASALQWSHDHRIHHSHVDTDKDPYSIKKGFWYAHIWWLFTYNGKINERLIGDLLKNPRVMFQHKHYGATIVAVNAAVWGIGCLFMSPMASFLGCVVLRIFTIHHCTWLINSLCHVWGARTYAKELSAVDNAVLAIFTFGEGYHNYHHTIANDYRNGIRWYHFDPTKWLIWTMSKIGLAKNLKSVNSIRLQRTLLSKDKHLVLERISKEFDETATELRHKLEELSTSFEDKASLLMKKLRELKDATDEKRKLLLIEIRQLRKELRVIWKSWVSLTEFTAQKYSIVA